MRNTEYVDICKQMDLLDFTVEYKSELESEWNNIDWDLCTRHIFKLQEQIFHQYAWAVCLERDTYGSEERKKE